MGKILSEFQKKEVNALFEREQPIKTALEQNDRQKFGDILAFYKRVPELIKNPCSASDSVQKLIRIGC